MTWAQGAELALHVATGIGLASCAGLRAFLPLLAVGLAGRFDFVTLSAAYAWLESWPALAVFGAAVVAELVGDKIPLVDNVLDTLQTFVKPCAGALLMASVVADWSPLYLTVVWIIMGGAMAGAVHVTKAKLRLVSTATTAGFGNPALSLTEDVGALAGTAVSIVAPVLVVVLVVVSLTLTWILLRRRRALLSR